MILLAAFDLDGTLLDTIRDLADSVNEALNVFGLPFLDYSEYKRIIGKGALNLCATSIEESFKKLSPKDIKTLNKPLATELLVVFKEKYRVNMNSKTMPYEGITNELEKLQDNGIYLAIISNKPDVYTKELVKIHFPNIQFHYIIGDSESFPRKPDPTSLNYVMSALGVLPSQTAYFGDSGSDIQTAIAAKALAVGVLWGFRDLEELQADKADIILQSPNEISAIILNKG